MFCFNAYWEKIWTVLSYLSIIFYNVFPWMTNKSHKVSWNKGIKQFIFTNDQILLFYQLSSYAKNSIYLININRIKFLKSDIYCAACFIILSCPFYVFSFCLQNCKFNLEHPFRVDIAKKDKKKRRKIHYLQNEWKKIYFGWTVF